MLQLATDRTLTALGSAIQMAIAPVFLLSGVAAFLNVLNARLSRVIDRTRVLEVRDIDDEDERELGILARRRHTINWAITLCTISALFVSVVVMLMFVGIVVHFAMVKLVAVCFIAAMLTLTVGLLCFLHEVHMAVRYLRRATRVS